MVGEDLANFGHQNSPRNTTQITHTIGTNTSVLGPDFNDSQSLLEVLSLLACKLDNHQVVLSSNKRSLALLILDSV